MSTEIDAPLVAVESSGAVCHLRLNRPDKLNALTTELLEELAAQQRRLVDDPTVNVVLLSAAGRAFCAGADVHHLDEIHRDPPRIRHFLETLERVVSTFGRMPQIVVAAVHGVTLTGGLELLLGADIILAGQNAKIGDHHMRLGLIPGGGSTQRLPRWIGPARALDLLLTGRWLTAEEAAAAGLVARVAPDSRLEDEAKALAHEIAAKPRDALRQVKRLARAAAEVPLAEGLQLERAAVMGYYEMPGFASGIDAATRR